MSLCNVLESYTSPEAERNASLHTHAHAAAAYKCCYLPVSAVDAYMSHSCFALSCPNMLFEGKPLYLPLTP